MDREERHEIHTARNTGQSWPFGCKVFFGLKIAVKPPDADHPYGHGKAEAIAALCAGLSLVTAAVAIMSKASMKW